MTIRPGDTWHGGVDLIAVERALTGHPPYPPLTEDEQQYAIEHAPPGMSKAELARRTGTCERTLYRWRESEVPK
ncbi:hypothetical protein [Streptomyces sp. NRRL B-1347]|uniref:hypothetical protein n=1 Tax=Streptomyces sp. NRRL B-1347 TaxID=1476877 RepID=UPI0004C91A35|nr:hypothetical protein [Streptomyces sp. NRRL B-1347]